MIADGNGFRTVRVPKHTDYYSAEPCRLASGSRPRGAQFPQQFCASVRESPLDQSVARA
jgi:hypothetical protein